MTDRVVVVGASRTAMGGLGGGLLGVSGPELAAAAIRASLERARVKPEQVDEVILGNVLSANMGQAPAKQAAKLAGIPWSVPCTLVNKVCASGMKACMLGAAQIKTGEAQVVVCGGFESMSRVPFMSGNTRFGNKFGHVELLDGLARDALRDAYSDDAMGCCGNLCAVEQNISRQEQDEFAAASYARAVSAISNNKFASEIAPVPVKTRKGVVQFTQDEEPMLRKVDYKMLSELPPAFALPKKYADLKGHANASSVTAGNASVISDGASCMILCSESFAHKHRLKVLAIFESWADGATDPDHFTMAPAIAAEKALRKAGVRKEEIDLIEINEAFAVVPLANLRALGLSHKKSECNIYGGGCSLGHPLGSSGCRIMVTMISALHQENKQVGLCAICNGGGGASAVVLRRAPESSKL